LRREKVDDYRDIFRLQDKVIYVAGGAGAIGSEIARAGVDFGARIVVADIDRDRCAEITSELVERGGKAISVELDLLDESSIVRSVEDALESFGSVDVLVNAAGIHIEQPAYKFEVDAWDRVLDVNLKGAFLLSKTVAAVMIANSIGGSHIHITSVRSALGIRRGYAAYVASKGGLGVLIKQLATEWAPFGIRVNGIAPTFTRTPLVADYLNDPDFYQSLVSRIPMARVCETSDLAGLAVFLASDASGFITGQNIFIDGGVTASQ